MITDYPNIERRRYYGIRIGDIVVPKLFNGNDSELGHCVVVGLASMDNNRIFIKSKNHKEPIDWVAEWCTIIKKVEEWSNKP